MTSGAGASKPSSAGAEEVDVVVVHDAQERASSIPLLLLLCVLWYGSSALSSNTSKSLLSRRKQPGDALPLPPLFPYPVTLTWIQFLFVNAYCYVGTRRQLWGDWVLARRLVPITWTQVRELVQISVFNVLGHALSSLAVSRVEVSLVHTIKALSPLFTVLAYALFFRVQYSTRTYVALLPLILGVVLACKSLSHRQRDDMVGFIAALGSTLIVVAQNIYSKKLLKPATTVATNTPEKLDKINILFYSSACSVVIMLPMCLYYDAGRMIAPTAMAVNGRALYLLAVNGFVHFTQNLLAFQVLAHVSPVTYSVANLFKRVFVILVAIAWFRQDVSLWQWIGIALTFLGLYLYNNAKNDKTSAPTDAPARPSSPDVLPMHTRRRDTRRVAAHDTRTPASASDWQRRLASPFASLPPQ